MLEPLLEVKLAYTSFNIHNVHKVHSWYSLISKYYETYGGVDIFLYIQYSVFRIEIIEASLLLLIMLFTTKTLAIEGSSQY